jgi:hypothetical protein
MLPYYPVTDCIIRILNQWSKNDQRSEIRSNIGKVAAETKRKFAAAIAGFAGRQGQRVRSCGTFTLYQQRKMFALKELRPSPNIRSQA